MDRDFSTNKNEFVKALSSIKFIDKYSLCDWHVLPAICVMQSPRLQMQTMQIYLMFTNSVGTIFASTSKWVWEMKQINLIIIECQWIVSMQHAEFYCGRFKWSENEKRSTNCDESQCTNLRAQPKHKNYVKIEWTQPNNYWIRFASTPHSDSIGFK